MTIIQPMDANRRYAMELHRFLADAAEEVESLADHYLTTDRTQVDVETLAVVKVADITRDLTELDTIAAKSGNSILAAMQGIHADAIALAGAIREALGKL